MADDSFGNDNSTCVVCFKNVLYYSIGECDHPVCFECSTRMRVLCLQNECPICRQPLARVIFADSVVPYKELRNKVYSDKHFERQFKIAFSSDEIKNAYDGLLENRCRLCEKAQPFRNFSTLSDHMRKVHERYFCDLCVKHLKIFTNERKCYTRQELAHHRRKGDPDDTSHRGHPLCEFCEERFMDADELYRHLRKEHLYCHLCDADGRNYYYASHAALAQHFRTDHYLCEEGECAGQHLTAVFRSEIDLKAHKASVHGKGLARQAARQARTLELQFNITPHAAAHHRNGRNPNANSGQHANNNNGHFVERLDPNMARPPPPPNIDTRSEELFPRLSAEPAPILLTAPPARNRMGGGLVRDDRNFPALEGGARPAPPGPAPAPAHTTATAARPTGKPSVSIQLHSQPASASHFRLTQPTGKGISIPPQQPQRRAPLSDDDFPSLGPMGPRDDHPSLGAGTVQPPKVAMINSQEMQALKKNPGTHQQQTKKPPLSSEAFPALSAAAAPAAPPQWIKVSKSKDKAKPKPEPPAQPRQPQFNPVADFPTLPPNNNPKTKSKKPTPPPQPPEPPKQTKKDKKKQNNEAKKENIIKTNNVNSESKSARDSILFDSYQSACGSAEEKKIKTLTERPVEQRNGGGNGDFKYAAKDYPALKAGESGPRRVPNGSAPPGFTKRPACDGLTFTNSAGQTFSAPLHRYIPPPDFEQRNRALVKKFASALGGADALEGFKVASRAFRDNIMSAGEFYQHCLSAMGSRLEAVFPELVALLPDIEKQQELMVGRAAAAAALRVCAVCGQLLAPRDEGPHDKAHWPALSAL